MAIEGTDMRISRRGGLLGASVALASLALAGCGGGGVPEHGSQAVIRPDYEDKQKAIMEGFKASFKKQGSPAPAKVKKAQLSGTPAPSGEQP
jgi:hypothetical protein